jgi:cell division protein FtsQ
VPSTPHPSPTSSALRVTLPRFAFVMAILLAVAAFPQSALFAIERIDVTGTTALSARTVIAQSGLRYGERLFATNTGAVLQQLLADPRVRSADLQLRPPHTVVITIVERVPVIALALRDQYAVVADDFVTLTLSLDPGDLPTVLDLGGGVAWAQPGAPVASEGARIAMAVLPMVPPPLRADLAAIRVAAGGDITLVLARGLEVHAGGLAGADERLAQVPGILNTLRARGLQVSSIDLRYAGSVVVRPNGGGEAR